MAKKRKCKVCKRPLVKKRADAVFCSDNCRNRYNNPLNVGKWKRAHDALLIKYKALERRLQKLNEARDAV